MKKTRKENQNSFLSQKKAGRPAIHDKGIRHISRERIFKPTSMHITIKVRKNKADIQSKKILKALHRAIFRARIHGLRVIHYTLEYNHIHLLVEASGHKIMHKAMQAFGISFSKAINKIKQVNGHVYKHRHHLRKITSSIDLKNVLRYIFHNGIHHKRTYSLIDPYNSMAAEKNLSAIYGDKAKRIQADIQKNKFFMALVLELMSVLDKGIVYFSGLNYLKN